MNFNSLGKSYLTKDFSKVLDINAMGTEYKDLLNDLDARAAEAFKRVFNMPLSSPTSNTMSSPLVSSDEDEQHVEEEEKGLFSSMLVDTTTSCRSPPPPPPQEVLVETTTTTNIKVETSNDDDYKFSLYSEKCPSSIIMGEAPECNTAQSIHTISSAAVIKKKTQSNYEMIKTPVVSTNHEQTQNSNKILLPSILPHVAAKKKAINKKHVSFGDDCKCLEYDDHLEPSMLSCHHVSYKDVASIDQHSINNNTIPPIKNIITNVGHNDGGTSNIDIMQQQPRPFMSFSAAAPIVPPTVAIGVNNKSTTTTKAYTLPDITFDGLALDHTEPNSKVFTLTLTLEGNRVNQFLNDFEVQVRNSGLNLDDHWYGLLDICFKKSRSKNMKLYLWFTKRLYDGQTWCQARDLIKRYFGFESLFIKQSLQLKFQEMYMHNNGVESFGVFYEKFRDLAPVCLEANIVQDDWTMICTCIAHANDKIQKEYLANIITEFYISKSTPNPDELIMNLSYLNLQIKHNYLKEFMRKNGPIESQLSWNQFDTRVRRDVHQVIAQLEQEENYEKVIAEVKAEIAAAVALAKRIENKRQRNLRRKEKKQQRALKAKKAIQKKLQKKRICKFCGIVPYSVNHIKVCEENPKNN